MGSAVGSTAIIASIIARAVGVGVAEVVTRGGGGPWEAAPVVPSQAAPLGRVPPCPSPPFAVAAAVATTGAAGAAAVAWPFWFLRLSAVLVLNS